MTLSVQQKSINPLNSTQQSGATNSVNSSSNVSVPVGQNGNLGSNVDSLNTKENTTQNTNAKRTVEELYNSISAICTQYGISLAEAKKSGLLTKAFGMSEEYLINAEQSEINKIVNHLKETLSALKEDGIEINITNLEKYARLFNVQIKNGWDSIASFRKANAKNHESLTVRLERMYGKDVTKLSTKEKAEMLEAYFSRYFNDEIKQKVKNASSPEEAERIKEQIRTKQITDFTKLLFNSSPKEHELFRDAIEYLAANKRFAGFDAILRSCDTDEQRTEIANSTTYEQTKCWETKADQFGDRMSKAEITQLSARKLEYNDAEHIAQHHEAAKTDALEFYTEDNKKKLEAIKAKIENGEDLTEEEQALLAQDNHFRGDNAGQMIGVGNNQVIEPEEKKEFLTTINNDAYKIGEQAGGDFYRDVMTEVADYVEKHPETLTMPKDEFVKLMNEATDGNYSKVVDDIENGTKTELTPPSTELSSKNNVQKTTSTTTESNQNSNSERVDSRSTALKPEDITKPQVAIAELYRKSEQREDSSTLSQSNEITINNNSSMEDYFRVYGGAEGFNKIRKEFGTIEAIRFTLNKNAQNATAKINAITTFSQLNCSQQFNTVKGLYNGLSIALDNAKENTLERLQHITLRTFGATKEAHEAAEESLSS